MKTKLKKLIKRKQDLIRELDELNDTISQINQIMILNRRKELQKTL